jgi:hypothetical protein
VAALTNTRIANDESCRLHAIYYRYYNGLTVQLAVPGCQSIQWVSHKSSQRPKYPLAVQGQRMLKLNQPQRVGTTISTGAGTGMGDFVVAFVFISDLVGAPVVDRVGTAKEPPWIPLLEIWWCHGKELRR